MKRYFFTGIVSLLPLVVTIWLVKFIVTLLTQPFLGFVKWAAAYLPPFPAHIVEYAAPVVVLLILFFTTLFLGFVARRFLFNQLIRLGDRILIRIPLVNKIYHTSKEIVRSLLGSDEKTFGQTVLFTFPNSDSYCLGLVSKEAPATCSEAEGEKLVSIFIPTTPNPSSGYVIMRHEKDLIYLDMTAEDVIKYVVSCAVIQPKGKR